MNTSKITFTGTKNREKLNVWLTHNSFPVKIGTLFTSNNFNRTIKINPRIYPFVTGGDINLPQCLLECNRFRWIDIHNGSRRLVTTRTYFLQFARQIEIDGIDYLSLPISEFGREKALQFEAGEMLNYSQILQGVI